MRLHLRLHKRRRHQLHCMAVLAKAARPVMGAPAGFPPHARRGKLRDKGHALRALEPLASQTGAVRIPTQPMTLSFCMGLASCGAMISLVWKSFWLIAADPHRGGSISLRPESAREKKLDNLLEGILS